MASIDFDAVRDGASLVATVSRHVELTQRGNEWLGCCPFHTEKTPSFTLFTGRDSRERFHCYGCGASGDVVDFVARIGGEGIGAAAARIASDTVAEIIPLPALSALPPTDEWTPADYPQAPAYDPARTWNHKKKNRDGTLGAWSDFSRATRIDAYVDTARSPICHVARFERVDGSKTIVTVTYAAHADGRAEWVTVRPAQPYPLFGLDQIAARPDAPVLVFEGEKKRALAEPLLTAYVCTTILGGTGGAALTDWTPLHGRSVVLWPDNNDSGRKCMVRVAKELAGKAESLALVDVSSLPDGHDVADLIAVGEDVADWLEWRVSEIPKPAARPERAPRPEPAPRAELPAAQPEKSADRAPPEKRNTKPDPEQFLDLPPEYSDDHLALTFAEKYCGQFCFMNEGLTKPTWMMFDGMRWTPDRTLLTRETIRTRICRAAATEAANRLDLGKKGAQIASALGSARAMGNVDIMARSDRRMSVTTEQFDADQWAVNTPSGVVDLKTGRVRAAAYTDYCQKITAVGPRGNCPEWLAFLSQACRGDAAMIGFLQRWFGYCLTGSVRDENFVFMHGPGGSGKSTVLETVRYVMGDYAQTTPSDTFMKRKGDSAHPTDIADMRGARFITAEEITEGKQWDEAKLKLCTGGVMIKGRFMNRDFFEFAPTFKLTFAGNNVPQLDNVDDAMRRRFIMVPFLNEVPAAKRDSGLKDRLKTEAAGILQWMVEGCLQWQASGLRTPDTVLAATEDYFGDQDVIAQFVTARLVIGGRDLQTASQSVYDVYANWCKQVGEIPRDMRRFMEAMLSQGIKKGPRTTASVDGRRVAGVVPLIGVRLKTAGEIADDSGAVQTWA